MAVAAAPLHARGMTSDTYLHLIPLRCVYVCVCLPAALAGGDDDAAGAAAGVNPDELDDDWGLDGEEAA